MHISYNSTSIARSCWMKYKWKYVEKLEPVTKSHQLTLGTVLHECFEMLYKGETEEKILQHIHEAYHKEEQKQEAADIEDVIINKYTALGMWHFCPNKNVREFSEVYPEEEHRVVIGNYSLVIKVDGRVKKDGVWWVRELKTTNLTQEQFKARAGTSAQATGYVYGLRKNGFPVQGIMFDYIKKPLLRKNKSEDMHQFGTRIMNDYKDRPKLYYGRFYSYRNDYQLKIYEEDMITLANDIEDRKQKGNWYRNQDACWNFNSECPYAKICFSERPDALTLELYFTKGAV